MRERSCGHDLPPTAPHCCSASLSWKHVGRSACRCSREPARTTGAVNSPQPCISNTASSAERRRTSWRIVWHEVNNFAASRAGSRSCPKERRRSVTEQAKARLLPADPIPGNATGPAARGAALLGDLSPTQPCDEGPGLPVERSRIRAYFLLQHLQGEGKRRYTMISAWWLVLAFLVGAYSGVLVMAIMSAARDVAKEPVRRASVRAHLRRTAADAP